MWAGYCHEACARSSTISMNDEIEFLITCKQCHHAKALVQNKSCNESPTSPLPLQRQEYPNLMTVNKGGRPKANNQSLASVRTRDTRSELKQATRDIRSELKQATSDSSLANKSRRKLCSWGIIWKKKNSEDTGIDFRLKNILLKGSLDVRRLEPVCHLCQKPYRSDLMYICCETCNSKFALDIDATCFLTKDAYSLSLCVFYYYYFLMPCVCDNWQNGSMLKLLNLRSQEFLKWQATSVAGVVG